MRLRQDRASLAIGMSGLVPEHFIHGRARQASQVGSELMALVEPIGDPTLTVALAASLPTTKFGTGEMVEVLRWSQTIIDLAQGDPAKGNLMVGSPLAVGFAMRGTARWALGRPGWRDDLNQAVDMVRGTEPWSLALVLMFTHGAAIQGGVLLAEDTALRDVEEALSIAQRSGDDFAVSTICLTLGIALMHRDSPADRDRGLVVLEQIRDTCLNGRFYLSMLCIVDSYIAYETARRGDRDGALPRLREAVNDLFHSGQLVHCEAATGALVETLLDRGADADISEARAVIERLVATPADDGLVIREIWLLLPRALMARSHDDHSSYRDYRDRYRDMATSLGFEGHMKWAEAMP
jgi:hypothetical protein